MPARNHEPSIWDLAAASRKRYPALSGDLETDVCVVGAGITGLTAALLLKKAGRRVVVVEKEQIGAGTTGGTSAHLTNVVDFRYSSLAQSYGAESARRVAESMTYAINLIERLSQEYGIDCAFQRVPGYYYAEEDDGVPDVQEEFEAARGAGLQVALLDQAPLPFPTRAAFRTEHQAQFQPMDYLAGLAKAIDGDGCALYEQTAVTRVDDGSPCVLHTNRGQIRAREVVQATHTPLGINFLHSKLDIYRSFVLAARVREEVPDGLYWDTQSPYHYIRTFHRGSDKFVIMGGEDHKVGDNVSRRSFQALEDYARAHFSVEHIEARWSAQFYAPTDHLPFIGKNPLGDHVYIATGYSGDGLTFGSLAGSMICNLIQQGHDAYEDLYHPGRVRLTGASDFIRKNIQVTRDFIADRLLQPSSRYVDRLAKGEGCVIRDGSSYVAVYRDTGGNLRTYSAICPHMRCVLRWNDNERSWDCPCHGSRFDTDGQLVEGPATMQLEPVSWSPSKKPAKEEA